MGYQTMLIPQDVVRRDILRVKDEPDNPSIELIYDIAMYGKRIGYDVIVEGILGKDKYGKMLQKLIKDFGGATYVYYFDIPLEETLRRHDTKPEKDKYGENELREWWAEKDNLGIKGEKMIYKDLTEDQIVKLMIKDIAG